MTFRTGFFRRLSYFVEKKGFRGSLMTNSELEGMHGWNAHDYRPEDLALFYTVADKQDFPLYQGRGADEGYPDTERDYTEETPKEDTMEGKGPFCPSPVNPREF